MGCCTSLPVVGPYCTTFCNLLNKVGCDWADKNRATLIYLNTFLVTTALVFACISVAGLSSERSVTKDVPWMTYTGDAIPGVTVYINLHGRLIESEGQSDYRAHGDANCSTAVLEEECMQCRDACAGLERVVCVMLLVNFATLVQIFGRFNREDDVNKKCLNVITSMLPIIMNIGSLITFGRDCYADIHSMEGIHAHRGIGWIALIIALFVGKIPNLFINLAIPAPDPAEIEKLQDAAQLHEEDPETAGVGTSLPKM